MKIFRVSALLSALIAGAAGADQAMAQHTGVGEETFLTDVTGPSITTGDQVAPLFSEPGPVRMMDCPVAWGVRTAAESALVQLQNTELRSAFRPDLSLGSQSQRSVQSVFAAAPGETAQTAPLLAALTPASNRGATRAARRLINESRGLLAAMQRINPLNPGAEGATRLWRAIGAYNSFIDASSGEFLASPPQELTALHSVLNSLVIASLENENRASVPSVVDAKGLGCAVVPPSPPVTIPPTPVAPPPVERAIEVCLYIDRNFRIVTGLYRPELGDTVTLVDGARRPFSEVYSGADEFTRPNWLVVGDSVMIGSAQYLRFGVTRSVEPGELDFAGQVDGVDYFVMEGERYPPSVVYFPVAAQCGVQPYRAAETIRVRG